MKTKNLRRIEPTEHQIQSCIIEWSSKINIRGVYKLSDFLIKNCNEGKRSLSTGRKMKKEGLRKGVSDLFLSIPVKKFKISDGTGFDKEYFGGLWLEIKSKKGLLSIPQLEWITLMSISGYDAHCIYTVDEGIQAIKDYLGMR